jgi:hypothetical protein
MAAWRSRQGSHPMSPPLDPEQCPGCGKLGDDCVCGLDVAPEGREPCDDECPACREGDHGACERSCHAREDEEPRDDGRGDMSDVPMAHELADDERWPYLESADFWREASV